MIQPEWLTITILVYPSINERSWADDFSGLFLLKLDTVVAKECVFGRPLTWFICPLFIFRAKKSQKIFRGAGIEITWFACCWVLKGQDLGVQPHSPEGIKV